MKKTQLIVVLICCYFSAAHGVGISEVLDVIKVGKDVLISLAKTWNLVDEHFEASDIPLPLVNKRERTIFNRINAINSKISKLVDSHSDSGSQVIEILKGMPEKITFEIKLDTLRQNLETIDITYERMKLYSQDMAKFERATLVDFANNVVSHSSSSIHNSIERVFSVIAPAREGLTSTGLLKTLARQLVRF